MQRIKQNRQREAVTSGDKTNKVEPRPNSERQKVVVKKTLFPPYFKNKTTLVERHTLTLLPY
jgi:hypothetical protein